MKINKEGYRIIIIAWLICLAIWLVFYQLLVTHENIALIVCGSIMLVLFCFFFVSFFREPRRVVIHDEELVFAPCRWEVLLILLPQDSEVLVEIGDSSVGSQTPIARLKK